MRVEKLDGLAVRAIPAMGPLCERSKACSCSAMRSINQMRNWRSTRDAASCCQPRLAPGSNSSASWVGPFARASHVGGSKPSTPVNSLAALDAACKEGYASTHSMNAPFPEPLLGVSSESWRDSRPSLPRRPAHWCERHPEDPDLP